MVAVFGSLNEILKYGHSNENSGAELSCGNVCNAAQGGSINLSRWMKSLSVTIQSKATEQCFPVVLFITLYKVVLTFYCG